MSNGNTPLWDILELPEVRDLDKRSDEKRAVAFARIEGNGIPRTKAQLEADMLVFAPGGEPWAKQLTRAAVKEATRRGVIQKRQRPSSDIEPQRQKGKHVEPAQVEGNGEADLDEDDPYASIVHIRPVDLSKLSETVEDRDQWFIAPLVPLGRRTGIFSAAGHGKSLLNLFMAASVATGRAVFHRPAGEPAHVVYVDSEMTEDDLAERLEDMGFDFENDTMLQQHLHYYLHPDIPPLDTKEGGETLLLMCRRDLAEHAFIDTVTSQVAGKENDADTYRAFGRYTVSALVNDGRGVTLMDHEGKDPKKGQRGSSGKKDYTDVTWQLKQGEDERTLVLSSHEKRRLPWVPNRVHIDMTFDPLVYTIPEMELSIDARLLVVVLGELGVPRNAGRPACRKALKEAGKTASTKHLSDAIRWRKMNPDGLV